jgi:hypothetical protein
MGRRFNLDHGNCGQQRLGIGMPGVLQYIVHASALHDPAQIHYSDLIRDIFDDGYVMRDEEIRQAEPILQILQQIQDLGLD